MLTWFVRGVCAVMILGTLAVTVGLLYVISVSAGGGLAGVLTFVLVAFPVLMAAGHAMEFLGEDMLGADLNGPPQSWPCQRRGAVVQPGLDLRPEADPDEMYAGTVAGVCGPCTTEEERTDATLRLIERTMGRRC
jgi:hypothetical protein